MEAGKTSRYLKYAMGEIILVVIGILIALQINNWNQDRNDRMHEAFLLLQINIEMQDNLEQLNIVQNSMKRLVDQGLNIVSIFPLNEEKINSEKFIKNFQGFLYCPSFDAYQGTIRSIISTGNLDLIVNDRLRKLIVTWEDVLSDYKEEEYMAWQYGYSLMEWATDHFPNPRYVQPQWNTVDYKGLQGRMGEKINRYQFCYDGEDAKKLRNHIIELIELTANYNDNAVNISQNP